MLSLASLGLASLRRKLPEASPAPNVCVACHVALLCVACHVAKFYMVNARGQCPTTKIDRCSAELTIFPGFCACE